MDETSRRVRIIWAAISLGDMEEAARVDHRTKYKRSGVYVYPGLFGPDAVALDHMMPAKLYQCEECLSHRSRTEAKYRNDARGCPLDPECNLKTSSSEGGQSGRSSEVLQLSCGHPSEWCTICLEIFTKLDIVRQWPCHPTHKFHSRCIAQWVQTNSRKCPICMRVLHESFARRRNLQEQQRRRLAGQTSKSVNRPPEKYMTTIPNLHMDSSLVNSQGSSPPETEQRTQVLLDTDGRSAPRRRISLVSRIVARYQRVSIDPVRIEILELDLAALS